MEDELELAEASCERMAEQIKQLTTELTQCEKCLQLHTGMLLIMMDYWQMKSERL